MCGVRNALYHLGLVCRLETLSIECRSSRFWLSKRTLFRSCLFSPVVLVLARSRLACLPPAYYVGKSRNCCVLILRTTVLLTTDSSTSRQAREGGVRGGGGGFGRTVLYVCIETSGGKPNAWHAVRLYASTLQYLFGCWRPA